MERSDLKRGLLVSRNEHTEHAFPRALNHESWAIRDAAKICDIIHLQSAHAITFSRFIDKPVVLTLHGPHDSKLSELYAHFPDVYYVAISNSQCKSETTPRIRTIYHGINPAQYAFRAEKKRYLSFIGRLALIKGAHLAIEVARQAGQHLIRTNGAHDRVCAKALKAGISFNFVLYDFRHTFATRMAQAGVDLGTLAAILGHNSLRIVQKYIHPTAEHKRTAMQRYDELLKEPIESASGKRRREAQLTAKILVRFLSTPEAQIARFSADSAETSTNREMGLKRCGFS